MLGHLRHEIGHYCQPVLAPEGSAALERCRALLDAWLPLTYALNAISCSLGEADQYPFVLAPAVIEKLVLIDSLARGT